MMIILFMWSILQWMPPRLEQVHDDIVEQYFSKIDDPQWEELNLQPGVPMEEISSPNFN
jgi:hypothetical protein